ncbi:hypothetical protein PUNSTDRAFT_131660 [Punctularia strigosozonata HHB-11173 SS5]|uniref:uncharacterized protein n=1 Tax=Punctularia strigosozonata (strain HHB-11173) TaxID=741275 RepID=UPI0004417CB6|nr:uncharacterized protein PUNSTDRAFT_131660 [Punctularia strigosozonata HHB-11173 SS5]EIN11495.1 hypothetical protein PUNSTDRAFT_131660 [Punctularia strigosozonata HHB-11173 SS5]
MYFRLATEGSASGYTVAAVGGQQRDSAWRSLETWRETASVPDAFYVELIKELVLRITSDTLCGHWPQEICDDLLLNPAASYYRRAEGALRLSYPVSLPLHQLLIDKLNLCIDDSPEQRSAAWPLPTPHWQWGRVASRFRDDRNFTFAEGAYSTVDRLLTTAMDNHPEKDTPVDLDEVPPGGAHVMVNAQVHRLESQPGSNTAGRPLARVVVRHDGKDFKIHCRHAVLCAGSVESAAILLRSVDGDTSQYGGNFTEEFGRLTDHHMLYVTLPFVYRNMMYRDMLGGMKLQTDITFRDKEGKPQGTALVNISVDAESFLPRGCLSATRFPQLVIVYMLPTCLNPNNSVKLDSSRQHPVIDVDFAKVPYLEEKKEVMRSFALASMKAIATTLNLQYLEQTNVGSSPHVFNLISLEDLDSKVKLGTIPLGTVAHELGTIPMPDHDNKGGIVDHDLKMKYGWSNVSVCDLSVFPHSPGANPSLTLAALALRHSDYLIPPRQVLRTSRPIRVYNMTPIDVYARVTLSENSSDAQAMGPLESVIAPGNYCEWKRQTREALFVYAVPRPTPLLSVWSERPPSQPDFSVQAVWPGTVALIVAPPPAPVVPLPHPSPWGEGHPEGLDGLPVGFGDKSTGPISYISTQASRSSSIHYPVHGAF